MNSQPTAASLRAAKDIRLAHARTFNEPIDKYVERIARQRATAFVKTLNLEEKR